LQIALVLVVLAGCDQPPLKEVAAAREALEEARKDGADRLAPERLKEAEAALATAETGLRDKDYRGALSAASDAAEKARGASRAAAVARTVAASAAEVARAEAAAALDDAAAARDEARRAKVPDDVLAPFAAGIEEARTSLDTVSAALERGDVLEAQKDAAAVKVRAKALGEGVRRARARWEAEHPRGRRPRGRSR
jgi:soluble cytochrome b562